jgi:CheY-like chemotaxis protein
MYEVKMMDLNYLNGKTILVVDDDKFNIQLIETMLQKIADVKVLSTDKGSEALTVLKTCDRYIDMILLDLHMPEMDGRDVLKGIRKELKLDTPVLIISVNGLDERELLDMGADDFVLKPFDLDDLKTKILKQSWNLR